MTTATANATRITWAPADPTMPTAVPTKNQTIKLIGWIDGVEARFALAVTPGRRWSLYSLPKGNALPTKAYTKTACIEAAEELTREEEENMNYDPMTPTEETVLPGNPEPIDVDPFQAPVQAPTQAPTTVTELAEVAKGRKVIGEIIAWCPGQGTRTHHAVTTALEVAGLDTKVARELLPRYAFSRACKKLEQDRIIDAAPEHNIGEILAYQFTKKHVASVTDPATGETWKEWSYATESILHVNKETGKVWCKNADLMEHAQKLVDDALDSRTGGDITRIVQKLFNRHADLFAIRDQGGAYFVPFQHLGFVSQIEAFLKSLGGRVNRFPIADAESGTVNQSIQETVASGLEVLLQEHEAAIQEFGLTTHQGTLDATAERINSTRVKIEAYADYLADKKNDLLASVEAAKKKLSDRIDEITKNRPAVQPSTPAVARDAFGCIVGSTASFAMREIAIATVPLTMKEIFTRTGLREGLSGSCYNAVQDKVDDGLVVREGNKYSLSDKGREIALASKAEVKE